MLLLGSLYNLSENIYLCRILVKIMRKILQLKISLNEIKPEIWRRFFVKDNISFEELHEIIQEVMGWENYHLWEFNINDNIITPPDEECEDNLNISEGDMDRFFMTPEFIKFKKEQDKKGEKLDFSKLHEMIEKFKKENEIPEQIDIDEPISRLINKEKQKFNYLYDFGDSWGHEIIVEKIIEDDGKQKGTFCLEGERACPTEDCGGVGGYENLIEVKKDKNHPDYGELIVNWLGEKHDFEEFDINGVNKRLIKLR